MAKITYGDELPDDSVGKKFQGAVYDTGSANAIAAVKGVNPVTQQGKTVVDQSVAVTVDSGAGAAIGATGDAAITTDTTGTQSGKLRGLVAWFARLGSLDGAAFTAGSSYVWPGLAGVYQSTVGTLTAGQRGLARLTSRRAVVTAGDMIQTVIADADLTSASVTKDGITIANFYNGLLGSTNGTTYGTASTITIPVMSAGYRSVVLAVQYPATQFDAVCNLEIYLTAHTDISNSQGWVLDAALPSISALRVFVGPGGAAGQGGLPGGATAAQRNYYSVPAMEYPGDLFVVINTDGGAPAEGTLGHLSVIRMA